MTDRKKMTLSILMLPVLYLALALAQPFAACAGHGEAEKPRPAPQEISEQTSCGNCGMHLAMHPRWQAQIVFTDGTMSAFDGCKCMLGFLSAMGPHEKERVAAVWVKDFRKGEWLDAENAYFVADSQELGPMGSELIPFSDHDEAMTFQKENGGSLLSYADVTPAVLKSLGHGGHHMKAKGHGEMEMEGHGGMESEGHKAMEMEDEHGRTPSESHGQMNMEGHGGM